MNPQSVGDAAEHTAAACAPAPDHTLVLVNGKRRHRASIIMWIGGGFADGAQGPDISAIPAIAVRQVEILRDGASAQYGSDAIAGVMNLTLKDAPSGGSFEVRTGTYWERDGESYTLSGNIGLPLGRRDSPPSGRVRLPRIHEPQLIQRASGRADRGGGTRMCATRPRLGAPTVDNDLKLWGNFGRFFGDGLQLYGHANYASETVTGGFFYRNPNTRAGVYSIDGGQTLLVGDVLDAQDGVLDGSAGCPVVEIVNHVPDPVALARVLGDPDCFTFQGCSGGFTRSSGA